jgi:hypothetical protein
VDQRAIRVHAKVGFRELGRRRSAGVTMGRRYNAVFMDLLASEFRQHGWSVLCRPRSPGRQRQPVAQAERGLGTDRCPRGAIPKHNQTTVRLFVKNDRSKIADLLDESSDGLFRTFVSTVNDKDGRSGSRRRSGGRGMRSYGPLLVQLKSVLDRGEASDPPSNVFVEVFDPLCQGRRSSTDGEDPGGRLPLVPVSKLGG